MKTKFIVVFRQYGGTEVVSSKCETHEHAVEAITDNMTEYDVEVDDLNAECHYTVYEVKAEYKYVPPTDKGSLVAV